MRSEGLFKQLWSGQPKASGTPGSTSIEAIVIRGARAHNLKGFDIRLPRDKIVVLTGPSGSGKSSLAFDTIYAEGQRRYVESLSAYARQFLEQMPKPEADSIEGLSPTISIDQKTSGRNPRSTVGTVTEIYDYLRVLYSKIAKPVCYECGKPIRSQSQAQIVDAILALPDGTKSSILAPLVRGRKGEYQKELEKLREKGFVRVRVDGVIHDLTEDITLDRQKKHTIEVYVDRLLIKADRPELLARVSESVESALQLGAGTLILEAPEGEQLFSQNFACPDCGVSYPEPEPAFFSFNSPKGHCPECEGLGYLAAEEEEEDEEALQDTVIPDEGPTPCPECGGKRLRKEALHFFIGKYNLPDFCGLTLTESRAFLKTWTLTERETKIVGRLLKEVDDRLGFLEDVGASYLSLSRSARSLSGGETQRIRLATQIGSALVGVIYVLDEPSIGLHARDTEKLLSTLRRLRDAGNTVLVVEHDEETMEAADWIVDIGPGAGERGGRIVAEGTPKDLKRNDSSITGKYLSGKLSIPVPEHRRKPDSKRVLRVSGAEKNNLKNVTLEVPLGLFTCITGVSGSGKSTLILDTLYPILFEHVYRNSGEKGMKALLRRVGAKAIEGLEHIDKVVEIDQSPIGRTPRSNPATYTGTFSFIRQLFAGLVEAQIRGFSPGRFSFNVPGGRCETCEGAGIRRIEMHFLPDVFVTCDTCKGSRYQRETLEIRYRGKSIADVLAMSIEEAFTFFEAVPSLKQKLKILNDVGLGYLRLGQSATTLSGGEAQRIKLSRELSKRGTGKTLYILDEPSTGLHFDDIAKLVSLLQALVSQGNTVLVIEHNLDIVKAADHVIDLGPEGGTGGGKIVAEGTPETVAKLKKSVTGAYLAKRLSPQ